MKYIFKTNIDKKEFDNFVENYPSTTFMQTTKWSQVKKSWNPDYVGLYEKDKLICTAMVLKRKLFLNKYLLYIPRGFVIDYTDKKLLNVFIDELKNYAKKNNVISIKIDPFICFSEDNIQKIKKKKEIESRNDFSKLSKEVHNNLLELGFKHEGYKKEVNAYIQPRYTMAIPLKSNEGKSYSEEELRMNMPKGTRSYIGSYQEKRGVEFSYSINKEDIKDLVSVLKSTESRQHVSLRDEKYFNLIMDSFKDECVLFFAHVNLDKYIEFLKQDTKENESKKEFNDEQMKLAKELKKKYGKRPLAGATLVIMPTCKNGIKTASFLYAGTNTEILPSLKITNGLMFYRLTYALNKGCDYCDLGGVDGSLEDHLSTFKSKFNPNVLELIGEYTLVINKFYNGLFNLAMKILKYIRSKR